MHSGEGALTPLQEVVSFVMMLHTGQSLSLSFSFCKKDRLLNDHELFSRAHNSPRVGFGKIWARERLH